MVLEGIVVRALIKGAFGMAVDIFGELLMLLVGIYEEGFCFCWDYLLLCVKQCVLANISYRKSSIFVSSHGKFYTMY